MSSVSDYWPRIIDPCSQQVLLRNRGAKAVIVLDEVVDEFVQPALKNPLDLAVFQPRPDGAGVPLRRSLTAIGVGDAIEILHQVCSDHRYH